MKPGLFKHELLATSDPLYAWIFQGLWCLADREGRLEDRPRRIHLEVNAGRAFEGTETALKWLNDSGLIKRYEVSGTQYIQVVNFKKHQNPHVKEPESTIPAPDLPGASPVPALLIPDSPSPLPTPTGVERAAARPPARRLPEDFSLTPERRAYGEREGLNVEREFEKFCDYWRSASGANARKHDWDAAWRNWCRKAADDLKRTPPPRSFGALRTEAPKPKECSHGLTAATCVYCRNGSPQEAGPRRVFG